MVLGKENWPHSIGIKKEAAMNEMIEDYLIMLAGAFSGYAAFTLLFEIIKRGKKKEQICNCKKAKKDSNIAE